MSRLGLGIDPLDVLVTNPAVWVAAITVIGGIAGGLITAAVTRKKDASETALDALTLLVKTQSEDNLQINERLRRVEAEVESLKRDNRLIKEKYSVAITYAHVLRTRGAPLLDLLDSAGIPHGPIPEVPALIAADFMRAADTSII